MGKFIHGDLADWLATASIEDRTRFDRLFNAIDEVKDLGLLSPLLEGELLNDGEGGFAIPIRENYQHVTGAIKVVFDEGDAFFTIESYD